jgi:hypothetical protein
MKSKKQLFKDLEELDPVYFKGVDLDHNKIGNETYGKDSRIYIVCKDKKERNRIEGVLNRKGHTIHFDYWPESSRCAVRVTYFKGWHWDE